jgi:protein-tyrosine phosphatase
VDNRPVERTVDYSRRCRRTTAGFPITTGMTHHERMDAAPYRICFVCSGNICRSPIAEVVIREMLRQQGPDGVEVNSAGTGDWHIGERADARALRVLAAAGYDGSAHRARQFDGPWFARHDLVIALDRGHYRYLRSMAPDESARERVQLLRRFDPAVGPDAPGELLDVPDPYYDGHRAFLEVLEQVEAAGAGLLSWLRTQRAGAD